MDVTKLVKCKGLKEKFRKCHEELKDHHEGFHKLHTECDWQHKELHRQLELQKKCIELQKSKLERHRMHRHIRFSPPIIIVLNLIIWYFVFKHTGLTAVAIFFAVLFSVRSFYEFFFLRKIESRILTPIDKLKTGIEEIAKGNYNVKVVSDEYNEISLLIDAFNEMAMKLQESENIQAEYEENRRALIANISHDLKTPITSIQGYIETITEENNLPPENINKYLKIIYNNTAYMNKLIDDLFLFSKLDMQKLEFQFAILDVRSFVYDLMEEFKLEYEEGKIQFDYEDKLEEDCRFNIDRKRLHQVFRNIIGNAIKYGSDQDLSIKTELYRLDDFIYIDIADNGPGIPKDKLTHIFDRFYRIDNERTKDLMSTGLGLAISKELIEAHNGRISVSSVENEGTCFTVMLPIIQ